jgi:ATP-dependent RNA helicase DHX29
MPPKKKKTQLKPIARGFATTSQPKKIIKEDTVESESTICVLRTDDTQLETDTDQVLNTDPSVAASTSEINTDVVQEQSLQFLVDKLQDKTEKEILRFLLALSPIRRSHLSVEPSRL